MAAWAVVIPMDAAKTRHQASLGPAVTASRVVGELWRAGGFYRAAGPVLLRAFPANAATFLGYEVAVYVVERVMIKER